MDQPIISFDEPATRKLGEMRNSDRFSGAALRVTVDEEGGSFYYRIEVVQEDSRHEADAVADCDGLAFYVGPESAPRLQGAELQYVDGPRGGGFRFENPNRPRLLEDPLAARVQQVLDEQVNPGLADHGGRVMLIDVRDGKVYVRFGGGCQGCGMADVTLKEGVAATLQREIPEIAEVLDATDHAAGAAPYYSG
jgi:Fe/S biogenesis protein NfuA